MLPLGGVTKTFAKKMEKNFEKLSIEEMSLVSGGAWTAKDYGCLSSALFFVAACAGSALNPVAWIGVAAATTGVIAACDLAG